jgi:tRNA(fMet)-specific endonuclease VapC
MHLLEEQFERLCATSKLRKIGRADLLIASIALANRATAAPRAFKHSKVLTTKVFACFK